MNSTLDRPPWKFLAGYVLSLHNIVVIVMILRGWSGRGTAALASPLADEVERLASLTWRRARIVAILVLGSTVLLIGLVMIALPGPALIVIPAGLAILGTEFLWARRLLARLQEEALEIAARVKSELHRRIVPRPVPQEPRPFPSAGTRRRGTELV